LEANVMSSTTRHRADFWDYLFVAYLLIPGLGFLTLCSLILACKSFTWAPNAVFLSFVGGVGFTGVSAWLIRKIVHGEPIFGSDDEENDDENVEES
jgi:hypothetical protein